MTVKLPGTYTGEQVVEAFRKASSFRTNETDYSFRDCKFEYQYEPESVRQTIKKVGVLFIQVFNKLEKMFWFFGPTVELRRELYFAELVSVDMDSKYLEVEVKPIWDDGDGWIYIEPGSLGLNSGVLIEKLIGNFYRELQSLSPSA